jgi:hypothetical protein
MFTANVRRSARFPLGLVAASALMGGACSNVVDLELEAQRICVASINQTFPAAPAGLPASKPVPLNFSAPLKQLPSTGDLQTEVRFRDITLSANGGDLGFIEKVTVDLHPSSKKPALLPFTLAEYARGTSGAAGSIVTLKAADMRNVVDYLADEPAQMKFTLYATLPNSAVTLDVEGCVGATARFQY